MSDVMMFLQIRQSLALAMAVNVFSFDVNVADGGSFCGLLMNQKWGRSVVIFSTEDK
jgi:hypothetical protein